MNQESYASYVRERRLARSTSEARRIVAEGTVRSKLMKFKEIEHKNLAQAPRVQIRRQPTGRSIYRDEEDYKATVTDEPSSKVDRLSLQFDDDLEKLDCVSSSDSDTEEVFPVLGQVEPTVNYESYDSDRTLEVTL